MEKRIIAHGALAGAIAGVVSFLFARVFVEPAIGRAIDFEDTHSAPGHEHGAELFTRGVQANVGMGFGVVAFAVAMGALLAVVFVVACSRFASVAPRILSILLALGAFGAITFIPALKYPPNPPSVGHEETLRDRTGLYLLTVLLSLALAIAAVWLGRTLVARFGAWSATLIAAAAYVAAIAVVMLVLPPVAETPHDFPADVLYDFRLYSLATQFVMWVTIGVAFASLTSRSLSHKPTIGRAPSLIP